MLLDSDIVIDILRRHPPAVAWLAGMGTTPLGLPGIAAMELIRGCRNAVDQQRLEKLLTRFTLHWPTQADCQRAYLDFAAFWLNHRLGLLDSLIGHTAVGLGEELATFNVKHYAVISGLTTVQPY
jgi:predicted nucleic acid-binding protein